MSVPGGTECTGASKAFILQDSTVNSVCRSPQINKYIKQKKICSGSEVLNMAFYLFSRFDPGRDFRFCPVEKRAVGTDQVCRCGPWLGLSRAGGHVP